MKHLKLFALIMGLSLLLAACAAPSDAAKDDTIQTVATTTMLADLARVIGGEHVTVEGLMQPGVDPHLYQARASDVTKMQKAELVIYNGLHLEGKLGDVFASLQNQDKAVLQVSDGLDADRLLESPDAADLYDPHIWFDVSLWKDAAVAVAGTLIDMDEKNSASYQANLDAYLDELDELDAYIRAQIDLVPEAQRVLITAHDAFGYFGNAYGFEVKGLQGISTDSEAATADVSQLADFIAQNGIKAIFVESSVPTKTIEALQAAVEARGASVAIGGELYSDSLGDAASGADSYLTTFRANIDTIVGALK